VPTDPDSIAFNPYREQMIEVAELTEEQAAALAKAWADYWAERILDAPKDED
jgi:hypothetical protein